MKNVWLTSALFLCVATEGFSGISIAPWTGELYEFQIEGLWQWSDYSNVANSTRHYGSTDQLAQLDLSVTPMENWDITAEAEFFLTTRVNWTARSYAVGIKKQFLNDLIGDPFAFSVLGKIRYVPSQSLDQISSPYSAPMNYSLGASLGKEWSSEGSWRVHIIGYAELGCGSQGAPWNYDKALLAVLLGEAHEFSASIDAYLGFGGKDTVNPSDFFGWGKYNHRSSDVKITYTKHLKIWGEWGVSYINRIYAFCYPDDYWAVEAFYRLPFSLF